MGGYTSRVKILQSDCCCRNSCNREQLAYRQCTRPSHARGLRRRGSARLVEYTVTARAVRRKQSRRMAACRFCGALLDKKHRSGLFRTIALEKDLPGRFSRLLQLPVSRDDGLSVYCCRKCVGRLNSVEKTTEELKSLANSSYSKAGYRVSHRQSDTMYSRTLL